MMVCQGADAGKQVAKGKPRHTDLLPPRDVDLKGYPMPLGSLP